MVAKKYSKGLNIGQKKFPISSSMKLGLTSEERFELITRNLQEVLGEEELRKKISSKKEFSVYWGTMPTGSISIAYFFPMMKIADFLKAGCNVKILLADLHAALDGVSWEILDKRYDYYREAIITILKTLGVNVVKLEFVRGRDFQLNQKYFHDLLKLSTITTINQSIHAASEAVKSANGDNVKLAGTIYPLMQALDEVYLDVDAQFAGLDQRKILVYSREFLPKIGYKERIELMSPMIRGLVGKQMSSSIESSKIDLLNDEEIVRKKINNADCVAGNPDNGVLALVKYLFFILNDNKKILVIERPAKYGGNLKYSSYEALEKDFVLKTLHPLDLKNATAREINLLLSNFRKNSKLKKLYDLAYEK